MTRFRQGVLAALLGVLLLAGCAQPGSDTQTTSPTNSSSAAQFPVTVDSDGTPLTLEKKPERIVSLSPAATELLFAVGAGKQVVAVDDASNYPQDAPRTKLTGLQPNVEAITGYQPDLVIVQFDANGIVSALTKVKIPVLVLPSATTLDSAYGQVSTVGKATGNVDEAESVITETKSGIEKIVADTPKPAKPLTYYHELGPELFSATSKTFAGQIYALFGLVNIADPANADGKNDYPQLSAEFIIKANPDLIFLADTKCCQQSADTVAKRPAWSNVTAVKNGNVVELDDDVASRWGPRMVDFAKAISDAVSKASK